MVPFIPVTVPSRCRRIDTSITLGRRRSQVRTSSMVPFIPMPVPSWCRRIDTSITLSGGDLRHEPPAWCRSFLCQCQAGVEESTLQSPWAGGDLRHEPLAWCRSFLRQCHACVEDSTQASEKIQNRSFTLLSCKVHFTHEPTNFRCRIFDTC
jgi:hypothetical protein